MKTWILICLVGFSLMNCTDVSETTYNITPELSGYVDKFYSEAEAHGVSVPKNLIAELADTQTTVQVTRDGDQIIMRYSPELLAGQDPTQAQATVCFYLGKTFLNRSNEEGKFSFMNFFVQGGYDPADEDQLWDELFE